MADPSGTWLDQELGQPGPDGAPGPGFIIVTPGVAIGVAEHDVTQGLGTAGPTRTNSAAIQTTTTTPAVIVSIPIPAGTSSRIYIEIQAKGATSAWCDAIDAFVDRVDNDPPTFMLVGDEGRKGGALAGCSASLTISGNNVDCLVTGPAAPVDWRLWWSSNDLTPAAIPPSTAPFITSLTPTHGLAGTTLDVVGGNFINPDTAFTFSDGVNTIPADAPAVNSTTSANIDVPSGLNPGPITVKATNPDAQFGTRSWTLDSVAFVPPSSGTLIDWWKISDASQVTAPSNLASAVVDQAGTPHNLAAASGDEFEYGLSGDKISTANALKQITSSKMTRSALGAGLGSFTISIAFEITTGSGDNPLTCFGMFNPEALVHGGKLSVYFGGYNDGPTTLTNGSRHVATFIRDNATSTLYIYLDGALELTVTSFNATLTSTGVTIGNDGSVSFFKGKITDAFIWSSPLNSTDRGLVEAYLAALIA